MFWAQSEIARLNVNAMRDARILMDDTERLLLFTDPTPEYAHGVLGDEFEAGGMTIAGGIAVGWSLKRTSVPEPIEHTF